MWLSQYSPSNSGSTLSVQVSNPVPQITGDKGLDFFLSGRAHAWYGALAAAMITGAVVAGEADPKWLIAATALSFGVFVDMWAHHFEH